ncbi:hypothetical protein [Psychrosphaera algicola]|uniref:Lipoprotein n=1 Tax=Psychrosphaera algicola TaxID=3023714 RepID=A0ABT5FCR6_9GAMM|nr:hypothetical protein [Psychrosphaera sp. G1-22]MDC2889338.1 hypothetical protein [Psychrosphaera sp. G1-22]
MKLKIAMVAIMALITGCTKTTYSPQAAVGLAVTESKMAPILSKEVEGLSVKLGFTAKSSVGNAEYFAKTNQFQTTLNIEDGKSFIMMGNLINANCVRLSVYSEQGKEDASRVLMQLTDALRNTKGVLMKVTDTPDCKQ